MVVVDVGGTSTARRMFCGERNRPAACAAARSARKGGKQKICALNAIFCRLACTASARVRIDGGGIARSARGVRDRRLSARAACDSLLDALAHLRDIVGCGFLRHKRARVSVEASARAGVRVGGVIFAHPNDAYHHLRRIECGAWRLRHLRDITRRCIFALRCIVSRIFFSRSSRRGYLTSAKTRGDHWRRHLRRNLGMRHQASLPSRRVNQICAAAIAAARSKRADISAVARRGVVASAENVLRWYKVKT